MPVEKLLLDSPLKEETYRRVYAAVLLQSEPTAIADLAGLELRRAMRILQALDGAGLVRREGVDWRANLDRVTVSVDPVPDGDPADTPIPRKQPQRLAFLQQAADLFESDQSYPEAEVNEKLKTMNPDFAALRRYLVEEGLMVRGEGIYRRAPAWGVKPDR